MIQNLGIILTKISISLSLLSVALAAVPSSNYQIIPLPTVDVWAGYGQLKKICAVESTGNRDLEPTQFTKEGTPLWGNDPKTGKPIKRDVGACQINTWVWGKTADKMGLDLQNSTSDNIAFGKWLYDTYGNKPWIASRDGSNGWGKGS